MTDRILGALADCEENNLIVMRMLEGVGTYGQTSTKYKGTGIIDRSARLRSDRLTSENKHIKTPSSSNFTKSECTKPILLPSD
jgi:hypothetical protein